MADLDLARIKRNVAKMAAQNAPVEDIDGYIASEGTNVDAVRAFRPAQPETPTGPMRLPPAAATATPDPMRPAADVGPSDGYKMARAGYLGALDGGSLSFGDELGSALGAASEYIGSKITGQPARSYSEIHDAMKAQEDQAKKEAPGSYMAGQIAGGIATTAPIAGGGIVAGAARSIPEKLAIAGSTGAAVGGVQGFGAGEGGVADRLEPAKNGAMVGGALGLAALPAGKAIGAGLNAATDFLTSRGGQIGRAAQDWIATTMARDGITAEEATRRLQQMGPDAMLADLSPGLRERAAQIAGSQTPAADDVTRAVRDRAAASGERVTGAFDDALGPRPNVKAELDRMTGEQRTRANGLYGQARKENVPVDVSPVIGAIDDQLLTPAERIAGRTDLPDDATDAALRWVRSHLSNGDVQRTGIAQLDRLERRIRGKAKTAFAGGDSDTGSALANIGRNLRDQMKASSSVYKEARETFADDASVQDAFDMGRDLFAKKTHPDFLAAEVADMSEAERNALRLGTRAAVEQAMGSVRNGTVKGRQLLDTDWNGRKLATVLGEDEAQALVGRLQGEGAMADTAGQVLKAPVRDNPLAPPASTLPRVPQTITHAGAAALQKGADAFRQFRAASLARDAAPALTATGGQRDALLDALVAAQTSRRGISSSDRELIEALTAGGMLASAPQIRR